MNGQTPWSGLFKTSVIIPLITLFLGFSLGFYATSIFPVNIPTSSSQKEFTLSSVPSKPALDESKLPVSSSLLTNKMVYVWRGSVNGKLIQKDEHTFTLEGEEGNKITITDIPPDGNKYNTRFLEKGKTEYKLTSLAAVPMGATLLGDFWIYKNGPNNPVGSQFVYEAIK